MKNKTVKFFNLKKEKHPTFGMGYRYNFIKNGWTKNTDSFIYVLVEMEMWAKNMQEIIRKEESY